MPGFKLALFAVALAAALWLPAMPARAQLGGIAAAVNDEVISFYDLEQRLSLVISSADLKNDGVTRRRLRSQVLRTLVDESLQLQEAKRLEIEVTEKDLGVAKGLIEKQNRIPKGRFADFVAARRISIDAVVAQIKAEIAWTKVVNRRLRPTIQISDEEIAEVLERYRASAGKEERRVLEIFLAVDQAKQQENVRRAARRLVEQVRGGADFQVLARQFSQGATAAQGGDVGWILEGQLAPELEAALRALKLGGISQPIEAPGGFYILLLRQKRVRGGVDPLAVKVRLKQIVLSLPPEARASVVKRQQSRARALAADISSCGELAATARRHGVAKPGDLGQLHIGELPDRFRTVVSGLAVGQASPPLRTPDGLHVLVICARTEPKAALPDRDTIIDRIGRRRLTMMSRRYLRDLRRDAVVEYR
ncbi:MAG: peptidylprolyl isomerase [Alphaproteobacteria bacterium]|nr:peptidylprolyl isomerase [Alphaproteobacteria bacterium]